MKRNTWIVISSILAVLLIATIAWILLRENSPADQSDQNFTPSETASPQQPTPTTVSREVALYFIKINANGQGPIGCGDELAEVKLNSKSSQPPLWHAIDELLSVKTEKYPRTDYRNALWQSRLKVESALVEDGVAHVELSGDLRLGGVCDNPRVEAQLIETAKAASGVDKTDITINGKSLKEAMSLR